jgi:hypothetical protein
MRDLVVLLIVVVLVYLFQCICWAPAQAQVFSLDAGRPGRRKRGFAWSALKLTGYWANPLPPLQPLAVVSWPDVQLGPEGLRIGAEPKPIAWEQVMLSRSGGKLMCNGTTLVAGGTDELKSWQELIGRLKRAKVKERQKQIAAWLRKVTDVEAAKGRLELFDRAARWLEPAASLQFFLLFIVTPLGFFRFGSRALWPLLGAVLTTSIFIVWRLWRGHKALFPGDGDARFKSVFSALLSPIQAIRALDSLARELLAGFHPVAVAGAVCAKEEFEAMAGEQLRALGFSQLGESWYGEQLRAALVEMLRKKEIRAERLLEAPEREGDCVQYCPRCRAQYTKMREECADCGFGPLKTFVASDGKQGKQLAIGGK